MASECVAVRPIILPLTDNGVTYYVMCLPPRFAGDTWALDLNDETFRQRLGRSIDGIITDKEHQPSFVFATRTREMSATLIDVDELTRSLPIGDPDSGAMVCFDPNVPAEGLELPPRSAFVLDAGGCALGVATAPGTDTLVAFHAGLASLVDFERVRTGKRSRQYESIVDATVAHFRASDVEPEDIRFRFFFGYDCESYRLDRPEFADFNRKLFDDIIAFTRKESVNLVTGGLDIGLLGKTLAEAAGCKATCEHPLRRGSGFAGTREAPPLNTARNLALVARV